MATAEIAPFDAPHPDELPCKDGEQFWVDPAYAPALAQRGLTRVEAVLRDQSGHCLRALADRENWYLDLEVEGQPRRVYLKKHRVRGAGNWLRARLGLQPAESAGLTEALNIARLARAGIPSMRLVAFGQRHAPGGFVESFLMSEELTGFQQLDHFIRARFAPLDTADERQRRDLRRLGRKVAQLAGRFHRAGFNHRDLYCCHFFIRETAPAEFDVRLIDLQRVQHRRRGRHRWIVKDLAQLAYSAPRERVTPRDRLAWIKWYLGVDKLGATHKRLIRQVLAKQHLMEWRLGKHP